MSVDGIDFKIKQPQNFDKKWFSHKFRGPGLCYEVALNIQTGDIVWSHGPFSPGAHTDLAFFCRVSHTSSNQVREWTLIGATGVGRGLFTFPTQMLVQGPYSELLRHLCARGMSCATVGSKHSRFWALLTAILARSMACIFDAYLWSRNFPLKLILVYLKLLIRR